jgi:hypothetical protein
LGIGLNLGPKISHTPLGIIENGQVPTGTALIFFCEHFKLLAENRPEIAENTAVQNHRLTNAPIPIKFDWKMPFLGVNSYHWGCRNDAPVRLAYTGIGPCTGIFSDCGTWAR